MIDLSWPMKVRNLPHGQWACPKGTRRRKKQHGQRQRSNISCAMRTSNDADMWVWPEADWYKEVWYDNDKNPPQQQIREKQTTRKIQEEDGSTQVQQDKDKQVSNKAKHWYNTRTLWALQARRRRPMVVWFRSLGGIELTDFLPSPLGDWENQELRLNHATMNSYVMIKHVKLDNRMEVSKRAPSFQTKHDRTRLKDNQTIINQRHSTIACELLRCSTKWKVVKTSKRFNKATRGQNCSHNRDNKKATNKFVVRLHIRWKVRKEKRRAKTQTQVTHQLRSGKIDYWLRVDTVWESGLLAGIILWSTRWQNTGRLVKIWSKEGALGDMQSWLLFSDLTKQRNE